MDKLYTGYCNVICFTKTHRKQKPVNNIETYVEGWATIHKYTSRGLTVSYDKLKVKIVRNYDELFVRNITSYCGSTK